MRKNLVAALVLICLSSAFFAGCGAFRSADQLKFGVWASEKNLWDEAIFRWKKALAANPKSVGAHNNLAVAYEKKGLFEEALKEYELALKLDPENTYVKSNYKNCQENIQAPKKETKDNKDEKK